MKSITATILLLAALCLPCLASEPLAVASENPFDVKTESAVEQKQVIDPARAPAPEFPSVLVIDTNDSAKATKLQGGGWGGDPKKFFPGAFSGFLGHESGHIIMNLALSTHVFLKSVHYGPIPFFTIQPGRYLTNREHYAIASAGFTSQNLSNEWLLTTHPNLRNENEPFLKGVAHFNFWLSAGYAYSAFTRTGPAERDTKGMADSLGWNERWVGAMILTPAVLDAYRYKHPKSKWAKTASRVSKLAIIALVLKAED